jgi:hypothetical protein
MLSTAQLPPAAPFPPTAVPFQQPATGMQLTLQPAASAAPLPERQRPAKHRRHASDRYDSDSSGSSDSSDSHSVRTPLRSAAYCRPTHP